MFVLIFIHPFFFLINVTIYSVSLILKSAMSSIRLCAHILIFSISSASFERIILAILPNNILFSFSNSLSSFKFCPPFLHQMCILLILDRILIKRVINDFFDLFHIRKKSIIDIIVINFCYNIFSNFIVSQENLK